MTRRTVIWAHEAEDELGKIWLAAKDRDAVASAADTIDALLKTNAEILGSDLAEGLKGFDCEPLRALFEIIEEDALVRVLIVKRVN